MKFVTGLLAAVLLLAGVGAGHAVVRIADDRGGVDEIDKFSVVPRVTDAQTPNATQSAAIPRMRILVMSPDHGHPSATGRRQ